MPTVPISSIKDDLKGNDALVIFLCFYKCKARLGKFCSLCLLEDFVLSTRVV